MKSVSLYILAIVMLAGASCKKAEERAIDKEQKRLLGTWRVDAINLRSTDTLGNLLKDTTYTTPGTVAFGKGSEGGSAIETFDRAMFEGGAAATELVGYFKMQNCGDPTTTGGWSLCWDADPESVRIQFWGLNGGGSFHRGVNVSYSGNGKGSQDMFYVVQSAGTNERSFYTWHMTKQ